MNAAVEAARAGEQGRGFAVVAAEVQNLTQRSAGTAKEIKALIGDSVEKVDTGSKLVDEAGSTMNEVVSNIKQVSDIMGEITEASREQSQGIDQIYQAITEMDNVTQQNAVLVEQAAAAGSMQDQAANPSQAVSIFKLSCAHMSAASAPRIGQHQAPRKVSNPQKIIAKRPVGASMVVTKSKAISHENSDGWEEF